jgi:toxin-antitoxin system PIN domain toxin
VILPDVNVLIYAFRADTPHHALCRQWLNDVVQSDTQFGVSPLTLAAVTRITTNPRIFREPSTLGEAFAFCDNLLSQPHCETVEPRARHWEIFQRLCLETETRGPRITDAWFAALAIEHGCTWVTLDRDYKRFPGLQHTEPLLGPE